MTEKTPDVRLMKVPCPCGAVYGVHEEAPGELCVEIVAESAMLEALRQITFYHHDDYRFCGPCLRALEAFDPDFVRRRGAAR